MAGQKSQQEEIMDGRDVAQRHHLYRLVFRSSARRTIYLNLDFSFFAWHRSRRRRRYGTIYSSGCNRFRRIANL